MIHMTFAGGGQYTVSTHVLTHITAAEGRESVCAYNTNGEWVKYSGYCHAALL